MRTREGRRALWTLLAEGCRVEESVIPGEFSEVRKLVPEPGWVYYLAGKRDVGNWLRSEMIEASPEDFERMNLEARADYLEEMSKKRREAVKGRMEEQEPEDRDDA